jgi:hypothetical protein
VPLNATANLPLSYAASPHRTLSDRSADVRYSIGMLTHADVRHLILTHKWIQDGHAFTVEYVQKKINEVALQKGVMTPKQQYESDQVQKAVRG